MQIEELKKLFNDLHEDRTKAVPKSFATEGIWDEQVEKYSEKAHFIYEVIQNADDSKATKAHFELKKDRLVFKHNGIIHFTVSPVETEREDFEHGKLGSLNSITAIAKSTKGGNAIGKFGVGFKSVFRYTATPFIYDDEMRFSIKDYIVPCWEDQEFSGRENGWTVFVFKFNRQATGNEAYNVPSPEESYNEIKAKLHHLVMPTLFLQQLEYITYSCEDGDSGSYSIEEVNAWRNVSCDGIDPIEVKEIRNLNKEGEDIVHDDNMLVLSRGRSPLEKYSICYMLGTDDKRIKACSGFATFCFFPTQQHNGLKFLVHGPFKLNPARETISDCEQHNIDLVDKITALVADSFSVLVELGKREDRLFYDDSILEVLPIHRQSEQPMKIFESIFMNDNACPSYLRENHKIVLAFSRQAILPTGDGSYVKKDSAYFSMTDVLRDTFPNKIFASLLGKGDQDAIWVFPRYNEQRIRGNDGVKAFLKSCAMGFVDQKFVLDHLQKEFIEKRDEMWLQCFYDFILKGEKRHWDSFARKEIFKDAEEKAVPARNTQGECCLFLPNAEGNPVQGFTTVLPSMVEDKDSATSRLLREVGVTRPTAKDEILSMVGELENRQRDEHLAAFRLVFDGLSNLTENERRTVVGRLKEKEFLAVDSRGGSLTRKRCDELYFKSMGLISYFPDTDARYLDIDAYVGVGEAAMDKNKVKELFHELGVEKLPRMKACVLRAADFPKEYMDTREPWGTPARANIESQTWGEFEPDYLNEALSMLLASQSEDGKRHLSKTIWCVLNGLVVCYEEIGGAFQLFPKGRHEYFKYATKNEEFENLLLYKLRDNPWLVCHDGTFKSPKEITIQQLNEIYRRDNQVLLDILGIKNDSITDALDILKKSAPDLAVEIDHIIAMRNVRMAEQTGGSSHDNDSNRTNTEEEKFFELDQDVIAALKDVQGQPINCAEGADVLGGKKAIVITIPKLFSMRLRVPDYQRPYKWGKDNVWDFMDDIKRMVVDKVEGEDGWKDQPYRMGSIILHRDEEGIYNIVDGQQRTLTFVLLALAIGVSCDCLNDKDFYPALSQLPVARRNLNNNLRYITDWLKMHGGDCKVKFKNALEKSLQVVVVCVDKRDYAFQLFDSQNVKGRRLEPHDLLKAYHLRELDEAIRRHPERYENVGHDTDDPRLQVVTKWEDYKIRDLSYLFDKLLYPILKWSAKERCYGFTTKDLKAFKGVPQDREGEYGYVDNAFAAAGKYQIGTGFAPGKEFFEMVSHYQDLLKQVREMVARCPSMQPILENASNNAYTKALFEAVLLAYFDRFGLNLPEGEEEINAAIRTLCKWVYSARLDLQYFSPMTPNKYALGVVDGDSKYTNKIAMFFAIRNAVYHSDIAKFTVRMTQSTRESQKTKVRRELWDLVNAL